MPKYTVNAEVSIFATIEPDGQLRTREQADEWEDDSSWYSNAETVYAHGQVSFQVEADDEDAARDRADDVLAGVYYDDPSGLDWEIDSTEITNLEEIEEPLDLVKAVQVVRDWLTNLPAGDLIPAEVVAAILFILDQLAKEGVS